jgi:hypothetical protein
MTAAGPVLHARCSLTADAPPAGRALPVTLRNPLLQVQ